MKKIILFLLVLICLVGAPFALADMDSLLDQDVGEDLVEEVSEEDVSEAEDEADEVEIDEDEFTAEADDDLEEEFPEVVEEEEEVEEVDESTLEEVLEEEVSEEELEEVKGELAEEVETVSASLPGGFSRFLARVGDTFTFNKKAKAKRAMERVKENKLRILRKMQEKQTGLARSKKFSAEVNKLQLYVAEDMAKAEAAVADLEESGEEENLEEASELDRKLTEQEALDEMIAKEAEETIAESEDLTSEEIQALNNVAENLKDETTKVKRKIKEKKVAVAAKLIAKGKSVKEVKEKAEEASKKSKSKTTTPKKVNTEKSSEVSDTISGAIAKVKDKVKERGKE